MSEIHEANTECKIGVTLQDFEGKKISPTDGIDIQLKVIRGQVETILQFEENADHDYEVKWTPQRQGNYSLQIMAPKTQTQLWSKKDKIVFPKRTYERYMYLVTFILVISISYCNKHMNLTSKCNYYWCMQL